MSKDISTMYTRERNMKNGRKGYYGFKREKETVLCPSEYGMYLTVHPNRKRPKN